MKDNYSSIDKALNIESSVVEVERDVKNIDITSNETIDVQKDYEYTRGNLYSLIEKGQEVLNGIMEVAEESASPRAYEVAGQLIKSVADTTDKLLDLQKKVKDVNENVEVKGPTTVNNALFVGSTAELSKLLKSNKAEG